MTPVILFPHKTRIIEFFAKDDKAVPKALFARVNNIPEIKNRYPLPFRKSDCTVCYSEGDVLWLGGPKGLARYCESEKEDYDKVMYFSAERDLQDNNVLRLFGSENEVWVETSKSVSHIKLELMSAEKKANMLLCETVEIVDRFGMISQRGLSRPWDLTSKKQFTDSDNDGGFTASFCIGEMLHYAVLKKEKGENNSDTKKIRAIAMRSLEACLLLMFISGRDDGFVARTYITSDAPLPDDGLFLRKQGKKAVVLETTFSRHRGISGAECEASAEIPERLTHLYRDEGYTDDDIIFKGDTSSDEITLHVMNLYYGHLVFGEEDSEIDSIIKKAASGLMTHIVSNEHELVDFHGSPTSWARWSTKYFEEGIGWGDAPLNAAEVLMYLAVTKEICKEDKRWETEFNRLIKNGYERLPSLHYDRAFCMGLYMDCQVTEDIMYGDHMLANLSFFGLLLLDKDASRRSAYIDGWMSWRKTSIEREHHPIYDIPFMIVCPEYSVNIEKLKEWFYRTNASRLASGISLEERTDVPSKEYMAGYRQTSWLLPPDERCISKYDRDSLRYKGEAQDRKFTVHTCSPYTLPYWMGRYYGIIKEGGADDE